MKKYYPAHEATVVAHGTPLTPATTLVPVFDVACCGPRNRFSANGKLVHNSGGLNLQNLNRGSELRRGIKAPDGHVVIVSDQSNIELRVNVKLCGQDDAVERLRAGEDLYSGFAGDVFGFEVNKKDNPDERFIGKVGVLSLGYRSGANTFANMVRVQSAAAGAPRKVEPAFAQWVVDTYRNTSYPMISRSWRLLDRAIDLWLSGMTPRNVLADEQPIRWTNDGFVLPSGLKIDYPELRRELLDDGSREVRFTSKSRSNPQGYRKLHGGPLLENICQALAREVMDTKLDLFEQELGYLPVMQVHDEYIFVAPEDDAEEHAKIVQQIMIEPVPWWPDLPLAAETGTGKNYGEAK